MMTQKKVLVSGCNGHMGQIVCRLIEQSQNFKVLYGFDREGGYGIYTNIDDFQTVLLPDIIIDFSAPEATMQLLDFATKFRIPMVIATTGFSKEENQKIKNASETIPIFQSANMSFEVCLIKKVLQTLASKLHESDVEILETHHNRKKDAPSGTALLLANAIKDSFAECEKEIVYGRSGKREQNEIGISALRGGNIVGEHSVYFYGKYETLEIKHTAHSRDLFAEGALKAAEFLLEKRKRTPAGLYTMDDLI